jgi:Glycerophosphoryl diester phosphodiesterase family
MKPLVFSLLLAGAISAYAGPPSATNNPTPLVSAHAHNDYEHKHPLFDALEQGFCSVEADIHLVDGKLLVAHDIRDISPTRTLESLYLEPLRQRVKQNGGRLYPNGPECTLLIDFKTEGAPTYAVLREVLKQYSDILTVFHDNRKETNAITAILTGDYSREALAADSVRYAACDGKSADLQANPPASLVAWISEDWKRHFTWRGDGPMPDDERRKLSELISKAHEQGRRLRFWDAPDKPVFWKEMQAEGVDLINTDDLPGLAKFLNGTH